MHTHRAAARLAIVPLVAATLVGLGASTPAGATPSCTDETQPAAILGLPMGDGCDDDTPPETTVSAATPPNAAGLVNSPSMTFTFGVQVTDADPGPFALECRLTGPAQAHDWRACTSPVTYAGLPDAPAGAYVFEARAVDGGDSGRTPDNPLIPPTTPDVPDLDPTPASVAWGQDTRAPFVFVTRTTYDEQTPTQPVVTTPTVPIRLNTSEPGSTLECTDNDRPVPCSAGRWELRDPRAGRHVFQARAIDPAGNAGAWSAPVEFFVPLDLRRTRGWTTVRDDAHYRGTALRARERGTRLVLPRTEVGELRLIAATGPRHGKVRLRVGRRAWHVVDLAGPRADLQQLTVLDRYSGMRTGRIVIETLSDKPVLLDAVVARPNRFPPAK
ncbi:hypothetical protein [Nocardioides sp. SYSU D00065]|uniref:hypothetical protein n=1 Tax=Nocardioides sp. SYSU D00065 TaxID=2817378 RepID=UPI001B339B17|nr:hypothetical protein [Nocardioides sp. SYSU D00065]